MAAYKKHLIWASVLVVSVLLLAACGGDESAPTAAEVEAEEAPTEMADAAGSEPSADIQIPTNSSQVPRMSVNELKERLDNGEEIVIVDTRSETSYDMRHIAGAISVPSVLDESPLDDLESDQKIVLYCT